MAASIHAFPTIKSASPDDPIPPQPPASKARKVWDKQAIVNLIAEETYKSNVFIEHALVELFHRQTAAEQAIEQTAENNGVGFGAFDAEIFSSFAKRIIESRRPEGDRLSPGQLAVCRKLTGKAHPIPRLARYAGQLLQIAEEKRSHKIAA